MDGCASFKKSGYLISIVGKKLKPPSTTIKGGKTYI